MRSNAPLRSFWFTAAKPPVLAASTRRLSCDSRSSSCIVLSPAPGNVLLWVMQILAAGHEPAGIDRVDADVAARGRGDGVVGVEQHGRGRGAQDAHRFVDVVVHALAHEQQRLAPASHAAHELGQAADGGHRVARAEGPFLLIDVFAGSERARIGVDPRVLQPVDRGRLELAAGELVDGAHQETLVVGEVLRVLAAAGEHHRRQIVGAEVLLDEAPRRRLDSRRPREVGVQVVEHEEVDASLYGVVRLDVHLDGPGGKERPHGTLDRDVHQRERGDFLRPAVLEHLEFLGAQVGHQVALGVGHERIHLHVVHLHAEGDGWRLGSRRLGRRLLGPERDGAEAGDEQREGGAFEHGEPVGMLAK